MAHRLKASTAAALVYGVIVAGMLGLGAAFYFLGLAPVTASQRDLHLQGVTRTFEASIDMLNAQIAGYRTTARQVGSRSALREALARFARGEISLEAFRQISTPKLIDALDAAPSLVGLSRHGVDGTSLIALGFGLPSATGGGCPMRLSPGAVDASLRVIAGHAYMQLCTPLHDKEGTRIGTDRLLFGIATMARQTMRRSGLTVRYRLAVVDSDALRGADGVIGLPFPAKSTGHGRLEQLDEKAETLVLAGLTAVDGLWLRADVDLAVLHARLEADHTRLFAIVAVAGCLTIAVTVLVLTPLLHAAIGAEAAEQKAEARADFLRTMSHELRTPINGVLGMADILAHQGLNDRQQRSLSVIRQSGLDLLAIVEAVLDATQITSGAMTLRKTHFDIAEMARDLVTRHEPDMARRGLSLVADFEGPMTHRIGDRDRVAQITGNLLANAAKFSDAGTVTLTIDTGLPDRVTVTVRDEGVGMTPEQIAMIFDPFVQTDVSPTRRHGGTGLGLTIVKGLATAMGGSIDVTSTSGAGSTFVVVLPLPAVISGGAEVAGKTDIASIPGTVVRLVTR
jgi:signal transduction histidine kinase